MEAWHAGRAGVFRLSVQAFGGKILLMGELSTDGQANPKVAGYHSSKGNSRLFGEEVEPQKSGYFW